MHQDFIITLTIQLMASLLLIRLCYFNFNRHYSHASAFVSFGTGVFVVTSLLHNSDISMGFAFGLFAVFSMLRYRTESISVKEMTYLFLTIAMALLNAVSALPWAALIAINALLLLVAFILETNLLFEKQEERFLEYDLIDNIKPENTSALLADLTRRTGWDITSVDIVEVDFLRDCARLRVQFRKAPQPQTIRTHALSSQIKP
ncbi:DUF4956 domain-containing protein [Thalassolituus sp. LLYu03]|uniref:DUF4956 domain-containing protein n=1 Tax=Thalassolituus sp. LLYu03 TaxID=3421656 RepID=UPI003D2A79E0